MARIIFPLAYAPQRELFRLIRAKHVADGAASPLTPLLTQKGIDLTNDNAAGNSADGFETTRSALSKQAEDLREDRDRLFDLVFGHLRKEVQFLKSFYKPNVQELGNWGITVTNNNRIDYPPEFSARVTVFGNFKTKHDSFAPGTSPLDPFLTQNVIDITVDETNVGTADTDNTNFTQAERDSEEATQNRNTRWDPVVLHMRDMGDYLMNLFTATPKKLGKWGFTVDDSPRAPHVRSVTLKPATQKTVKGIVLGGTLTNTGTTSINVFKGATATGTPQSVAPNDMIGMTKGHSSITVQNPSTTITARFTVLIAG